MQQKNCLLLELDVKIVNPELNEERKSWFEMPHSERRLANAVPFASPKKKEAEVCIRKSGIRSAGSKGRPLAMA